MAKKRDCVICGNGTYAPYFVFADDEDGEIIAAEYCPMCGRELESWPHDPPRYEKKIKERLAKYENH